MKIEDKHLIGLIIIVCVFVLSTLLGAVVKQKERVAKEKDTAIYKFNQERDSFIKVIHFHEFQVESMYKNINNLELKRNERNEKLIKQIDSIRSISDSMLFVEWAARYGF